MERTISLKLPTAQSPGFFRFLRGFAVFAEVMGKPLVHTPSEIDEALEWLVSIVDEPKDRKEARRLIEGMSADQLGQVIKEMGESASVSPDPLPSPG
jgi:hypothetical protein